MDDYTLSRTGAQIDAIGELNYTATTVTTLAPNTETDLCSFTLSAGVWVVISYFRFARGSENYQASLGLSDVSGSSQTGSLGYTQFPVTEQCNIPAVGTTRVFNLSTSKTIYLVGWHNGTSAKNVFVAQMQAVRIK